MDRVLVLEYQNNFADNLTEYAYGQIIKNMLGVNCAYENSTLKRESFENLMNDFSLDFSYISSTRVNKISKKTQFMDLRKFQNKKYNKDTILKYKNFKLDDIQYINDDIKLKFNFKNIDFIKNYDILDDILAQNSIGLYINNNDLIEKEYIIRAYKRLNKYIKRPKLYLFTNKEFRLDSDIIYKIVNTQDWREEFYFLQKCKHNIIYCAENSYSIGIWAAILNKNKFGYVVIDKKMKKSDLKNDYWLFV